MTIELFSRAVNGARGIFVRDCNDQTRGCIGIGGPWNRRISYACGTNAIALCMGPVSISYITAIGAKPLPKWLRTV